MLQLWLFVTPVIYPSSVVPERWRWVLALNPMSGLIDGFRAAFLSRSFDGLQLGLSMSMTVVFLIVGVSYFQQLQRRLTDVI
jgi:lipopolysaccharide transport system permease protein